MSRDELQDLAVRRLEKTKRLICQWATGVGKSNVALKFLAAHPEKSCLILVPEQNNIQNWEDEFEKFNVQGTGTVTIMCYASFHKLKGTAWDLVVFDEMPHVDTQKRLAICNSVTGEYILALGAVITDDERQSLESVYGAFDKSIISLSRAIELGFLPSPRVNVMHLQMDDATKERYQRVQKKVDDSVEAFNLSSNKFNHMRMLRAGNERKRFLGELKEDAIRRICEKLVEKEKRFLCFCSSVKLANKLGGEHAFTSETPTSKKLLEKFNNHEIDSLYVVGKLIEGQNLNDIQVGVIGQLGGTQRITVQSIGRVMRSQNPIIYVPVFDGTKDDGFLYTLTANIPAEYIKHYKF